MNVILIDDEEVALNALCRRVNWEKYGFERVFTAHSMKQAQEIFCREKIHVMLCDVEMPQGNGLELFEWVKARYPAVECVYVTCHPEFEYMRRALRLGSADYILKPIDYAELDEVLSALTARITRRAEGIPARVPEEIAAETGWKPSNDVIDTVKKYIHDHLREDIYISDIAGKVFLNEQYLMRLFKKNTGLSILEYITDARLWMAKQLLVKTDHPIKWVADSVGYGNYSYFTKIFKRSVGVTPVEYRKAHQGDKETP